MGCHGLQAQTAVSLFWKSDGVQVNEIVSEEADQYKKVGHHGPAVENTHFALRIYFNDSGAIDVYSKSGRGLELEKYKWYPTEEQQQNDGAGCDEYRVGKTVGLGGIALWDGKQEVKLKATGGRTARVGDTKTGSFAEMIAYGVPYQEDTVDISIRIDMNRKTREAVVTATSLTGMPVMFLTGVNYHPGETCVRFPCTYRCRYVLQAFGFRSHGGDGGYGEDHFQADEECVDHCCGGIYERSRAEYGQAFRKLHDQIDVV